MNPCCRMTITDHTLKKILQMKNPWRGEYKEQ